MPQSGIDKRAIAKMKMMRDIQREFDKHPIRVPLQTKGPRFQRGGTGSTAAAVGSSGPRSITVR